MVAGSAAPVAAGLVAGISLVALMAIMPVTGYPFLLDSFQRKTGGDYTPLLQMKISGLKDSYVVGEGVEFAVRQIAGGDCSLPDHIMIKDLGTGRIVKEWDGKSTLTFCGRVMLNPATSGATWTTTFGERPVIFNQTGSYAIVAKHLFKTVQKEFKIAAIGEDGRDTSPETAADLQRRAGQLDIVKALLERYPDTNMTVTANYYSGLFEEFQEYRPSGIVQYSVATWESHLPPSNAAEAIKELRKLVLTIIFDRYYENNTSPLVVLRCIGENYRSSYIAELYMPQSRIADC